MWRVKVKSISFYIILLLFNLGWTFMYCSWILHFLPVWHVIWFLVFSSYDIILNFVVFFENVFHVVPVEDPTLREMAEYMEVNRYAQKWRTFFVAQDYSWSSIIQTFSLVPVLQLILMCHDQDPEAYSF